MSAQPAPQPAPATPPQPAPATPPQPQPAHPMLELSSVSKSFGDKQVLQGLNLSVQEGDVICLIGASGCGKSTLLRCVNLLDQLDSGTINFLGTEIAPGPVNHNLVRQKMGIVFQSFNLFPHMNVLENMTLGLRVAHKQSTTEANAQAEDWLEKLDLSDKIKEYPERLSGGQQQRVAIGRAMIAGPELLLLDEVTSALDPELVGEVLSIMKRLATGKDNEGKRTTMLVATHEMNFAREVASLVCFMHNGVIWESGPPKPFFDSPQTPEAQQFLGRLRDGGRL